MPIFLTWIYIFSVNNSFLWYDKALACAVRLLLNILIFISINFFIFAVMMMIIRMIVVLISKIMISDSVNDYEIGSNKVKGNKWSDTDTVEKIRIQMLRVMVTTTMILCYKLTKKKKKKLIIFIVIVIINVIIDFVIMIVIIKIIIVFITISIIINIPKITAEKAW